MLTRWTLLVALAIIILVSGCVAAPDLGDNISEEPEAPPQEPAPQEPEAPPQTPPEAPPEAPPEEPAPAANTLTCGNGQCESISPIIGEGSTITVTIGGTDHTVGLYSIITERVAAIQIDTTFAELVVGGTYTLKNIRFSVDEISPDAGEVKLTFPETPLRCPEDCSQDDLTYACGNGQCESLDQDFIEGDSIILQINSRAYVLEVPFFSSVNEIKVKIDSDVSESLGETEHLNASGLDIYVKTVAYSEDPAAYNTAVLTFGETPETCAQDCG
jgi:hypothetical protein